MILPIPCARDGFIVDASAPTAEAHRIWSKLFDSLPENPNRWDPLNRKRSPCYKSPVFKQILNSPPEKQLLLVLASMERSSYSRTAKAANWPYVWAEEPQPYPLEIWETPGVMRLVWDALAQHKLPWTLESLETALTIIAKTKRFGDYDNLIAFYPYHMLVRVAAEFRTAQALPNGICNAIRRILKLVTHGKADAYHPYMELEELLIPPQTGLFDTAESWAKKAAAEISALPAAHRAGWESLIQHAAAATGTKPSQAWLKTAEQMLLVVGRENFIRRTSKWFAAVTAPKPKNIMQFFGRSPMRAGNAKVLNGLAWMAGLTRSSAAAGPLGVLALKCFAKVPGYGAFSTKIANACVSSLVNLPGRKPIVQLSLLRSSVKTRPAQAVLQAALLSAGHRR
jgi:hypothetical protein